MGAHAFQDRVERLAAVVQSQPIAMPKKAEVLTLRRVGLVRVVNKVIVGSMELRTKFIVLLRDIPDKTKLIEEAGSDYDFSESLARLNAVSWKLRTSVLEDNDGDNIVDFLEDLANIWAKKSADDGRFMRRLAHRVKYAGEACDAQRLKVLNQVEELLKVISDYTEQQRGRSDGKLKYDSLIDAHLAKYQIAMDYLAR